MTYPPLAREPALTYEAGVPPLRRLAALAISGVAVGAAACSSTPAPSEQAARAAVTSSCVQGTVPRTAGGTGCESILRLSCDVPPVPSLADVNLATDVVYTTPYRGESYAAPQALDVAWPRGGGTHPVVLMVHGGGWDGGDKTDHRQDILLLASQGYVALSVNYRLVIDGWQNRFPAAPSDVRCAVRWAKHHAASYGGDPSRVVAMGDSAGGELVELLATEPGESQLDDGQCETSDSPAITAAIPYYGRAVLSTPPIPDYLVDYIGRDGDWQTRENQGSGGLHVTADTVPMLLLHGTVDDTVPIEQSRAMRDAMVAANVPVGLMELPGQGHGFPFFGTDGNLPMASCSSLTFLGHFARNPAPTGPTAVHTVIYVQAPTQPGQSIFLRGGHDESLVSAGHFEGADEPIFFPNELDPATSLLKPSDAWLTWWSDSPLDWTCTPGTTGCGPDTYAAQGFGEDPQATGGLDQWKLDVTMTGEVGDWFEVKALLRSAGVDTWEGAVHQSGAPYVTTNHWARKGYVTRLGFGQDGASLEPLP